MEENITLSTDESVADGALAVNSAEVEAVAVAPAEGKPKRRINQAKLQDNIWGWIFCLPLIIGTVWFVYYAFILAFLLSFTNYTGNVPLMEAIFNLKDHIHQGAGGGFHWYRELFTKEIPEYGLVHARNEMGAYLFNTVFYMIGIPIGMVLAVFFAVCMSRDIKGGNVFRVLYYLPCVASTIAVVYTFKLLFAQDGLMNSLLGTEAREGVGLAWIPGVTSDDSAYTWNYLIHGQNYEAYSSAQFMVDPYWCHGIITKCVVIIMSVWKGLGGTIILYVAGLSGVNASTKEAAQIDGANGWQIFWKITMPDLYPVIFYNIVTSVIGGLQIYAEPELLISAASGSGAFPNTSGFVSLIWKYGLSGTFNYGQGAAYGIFLAAIILILTIFQFWLDKRNAD